MSLDLLNFDGSPRFVNGQRLFYDVTPFVQPSVNSPVFQNFTYSSSNVPTQFSDAIQRAEYNDNAKSDWHTLLASSRALVLAGIDGPRRFAEHAEVVCVDGRPTGELRENAAMDLVRHGIRVNSLTPTATDVEEGDARAVAWGRARPDRGGRVLDFAKMLPMDRLPSPRDYAQAAVFLASDDSRMITGIDLRVDGGAVAKYWPWIPHA